MTWRDLASIENDGSLIAKQDPLLRTSTVYLLVNVCKLYFTALQQVGQNFLHAVLRSLAAYLPVIS